MKRFLSLLVFLLSATITSAQQATNFQCNDCSDRSRDFFSELDAGKVVVMCWVMPCGTCIGPAMTCYNIVKSYQQQYPEKVAYFLIDDFADTDCKTLSEWAGDFNMPTAPFMTQFSNNSIKMNAYGSNGMPKVVVVAPNRKVLYNANNTVDAQAIQTAITSALVTTGNIENFSKTFSIQGITPNPSGVETKLYFNLVYPSEVYIEISDVLGRVVSISRVKNMADGSHSLSLDTESLKAGYYSVKLNCSGHTITTPLVVTK